MCQAQSEREQVYTKERIEMMIRSVLILLRLSCCFGKVLDKHNKENHLDNGRIASKQYDENNLVTVESDRIYGVERQPFNFTVAVTLPQDEESMMVTFLHYCT